MMNYREGAATKKTLTNEQKEQINANWEKRSKEIKKTNATSEHKETKWEEIFDEVQQFGTEIQELREHIKH